VRSLRGIFLSALAIGFSGAMIPGPMLALVLSEGLGGDILGVLGIVLGHVLLEGALVAALSFGAGSLLRRPAVGMLVGIPGGALLSYMGASVVVAVLRDPTAIAAEAKVLATPAGPVVAGVLVSASNPSWIMWWSGVGVGYVSMALRRGTAGLVSFYVGHTLSDWAWYGALGVLLVGGREILRGQVYLWVIGGCGAVLFGFGLYFVYLGLNQAHRSFGASRAEGARP